MHACLILDIIRSETHPLYNSTAIQNLGSVFKKIFMYPMLIGTAFIASQIE